MMHPVYLPFTETQLFSHFAEVKKNKICERNRNHLNYYRNNIKTYIDYLAINPERKGKSLDEMREPCQIEKDEKFWTAACLMTIFYSNNRKEELAELFGLAYGDTTPFKDLNSWEECLDGELHLFFEANLRSPTSYKKELSLNIHRRQIIPHILDSADGKKNLEGSSKVDAILINSGNGFAVVFEAKVLSDISLGVTYDTVRNQIARTIDIMLENNKGLCHPLDKRDPDKTLFLLVTPRLFQDNPRSRLYGYKYNDYKNNPTSMANDLPHRNFDWQDVSKRLGWLTWEDFKDKNNNCCLWLK